MKKIIEMILRKMSVESIDGASEEYRNIKCIIVTVIMSTGSTPRKSGASMLVDASGILEGTIGGGLLEYTCMKHAQNILDKFSTLMANDVEVSPSTEEFVLDNAKAGALGMICGGNTKVLYFPIKNDGDTRSVMEEALRCISENQEAYLSLGLLENTIRVFKRNESLNVVTKESIELPLVHTHRVILVGGGHVAMEVAKLLTYLEFQYVIIDDRDEFATRERFPEANEIIVAASEQYEERLMDLGIIGNKDAFCIMTRGHMGDAEAIKYALSTYASYIGVMGSKAKREKVFAQLELEGYSGIRERVTTPIGLDIGAETPEELAVSVVGQLIQWRASKKGVIGSGCDYIGGR